MACENIIHSWMEHKTTENQLQANSFHWRSRTQSDLSEIYVWVFSYRLVVAQDILHLSSLFIKWLMIFTSISFHLNLYLEIKKFHNQTKCNKKNFVGAKKSSRRENNPSYNWVYPHENFRSLFMHVYTVMPSGFACILVCVVTCAHVCAEPSEA